MKIDELMVGDWYYWEAEGKLYPYQVKPEDFVKEEIPNFQPIPLTSEILKKNGWVLKEWGSHKQFQYTTKECGDEFTYKIDYIEPHFIVSCFRHDLEIMYVHQLQHILKTFEIKKDIIL